MHARPGLATGGIGHAPPLARIPHSYPARNRRAERVGAPVAGKIDSGPHRGGRERRGRGRRRRSALHYRAMPVGRPRYATLEALLQGELVRREHPATAMLMRDLAAVRAGGVFTRAEFERMCRWKSPRAQHLWRANSAARIRAVSRAMLATRSERRRMELLTSLRGVGVPIASAILTLIDPRRYGVLDIRCWQLLFAVDSVSTNRRGQGFTIAHWEQYLSALRHYARRLGVTARTIEYTLFEAHRNLQQGLLYARSERRLRRRNRAIGAGGRQGGARRTACDDRRPGSPRGRSPLAQKEGEAPLRGSKTEQRPRGDGPAPVLPSGSGRGRRRPGAGRGRTSR